MGLFDKLKGIAVKKFAEKSIKGALKSGVAIGAVWLAKTAGVELNAEQQGTLIIAGTGVIFGVANQLKHSFPKIFGWL